MHEGIKDPIEFSRVEETIGPRLVWPKGCLGCEHLDLDDKSLFCKKFYMCTAHASIFCKRSSEWIQN